MKNSTRLINVAFISMLFLSIQGCASLGGSGATTSSPDQNAPIEHIIKPGDQLGDIALRYTGNISRWKAIAAYNDIQDPRSLRVGDIVSIPVALVPEKRLPAVGRSITIARKDSLEAASAGNSASATVATTGTGSLAVQRSAGNVIVRPVSVNRTFTQQPLEKTAKATVGSSDTQAPQVRVVGTYYPKGIYKQPAGYSTLMMRVAPGTVFQLEREVNDWYKVITNKGTGYLRLEDGIILSAQ